MCEFMSWIEYQGKIYFLDDNKLNTKEGRELLQYLGDRKYEDIPGHGAILHYYPELKHKGKDKECTDFSTPDNFPSKIVEAIKKGLFVNFGACPQILTASALDLFLRSETGKIYAELEKARAEWEKACDEWYNTSSEWEKADKSYFWQLARIKKNRIKLWQ